MKLTVASDRSCFYLGTYNSDIVCMGLAFISDDCDIDKFSPQDFPVHLDHELRMNNSASVRV